MNSNQSKISCKQGFTLIELLVVVLIIGILAAVAVPQYRVAVKKAQVVRALSVMSSISKAQRVYYLANGEYTNEISALDVDVAYTSSSDGDNTSWGTAKNYDGVNGGRLRLYSKNTGVVWWDDDVVFNFKESSVSCHSKPGSSLGEKTCRAFGTSTGKLSDLGTPVYDIVAKP